MDRWVSLMHPKHHIVHFIHSNMIKLQRPSSCAQLYITPDNGVVTVQFKASGTTQTFTDVNKGDIENLLNDTTVSVGKWVNQVLLGREVAPQAIAA